MRAVIVEDEFVAAESLKRLISEIDKTIEVIAVLQSVDEAVEWFGDHEDADLVFMDIHLADGDSFTIFERVEVTAPVIFTTAYDEYALKAFEVNSIDYLLKPISRSGLKRALEKMRHLMPQKEDNGQMVGQLLETMRSLRGEQTQRHFLIPFKDKLIPISTEDIAFIYSEDKVARVVCFDQNSYQMDESLDGMLRQLPTQKFFRANRQYIISHSAIEEVVLWFNGKLLVNLALPTPDRVIISRARSTQFKEWYVGNMEE